MSENNDFTIGINSIIDFSTESNLLKSCKISQIIESADGWLNNVLHFNIINKCDFYDVFLQTPTNIFYWNNETLKIMKSDVNELTPEQTAKYIATEISKKITDYIMSIDNNTIKYHVAKDYSNLSKNTIKAYHRNDLTLSNNFRISQLITLLPKLLEFIEPFAEINTHYYDVFHKLKNIEKWFADEGIDLLNHDKFTTTELLNKFQ